MVFGLGKKKIQEQPAPAVPSERSVTLDEIAGVLQRIETPMVAQAVDAARSAKDEVESHRKKILDLILHLESDDLKLDDVDRNLGVIVKRGKDAVVSTIKKETSSVLTSASKYEQVVLLNAEIAQMLKKIGDVLGLNSRIIHIFAKKYADSLKAEIAKIAQSRNQLQASINAVERLRTDGKAMAEIAQKISEYRTSISQKRRRVSEIESEAASLDASIADLERQIRDLRSSEEHAKFLEVRARIDALSSEKDGIRKAVDLQFSKISRPLGRYSYISSFEKPIRKIMDEILANPYDAISRQDRGVIVQILEAVEKSVVSGSISVKDSDRALEHIQETISRLDEFIASKESYSGKVSALEKDLQVFDSGLLEAREHGLQKARADIANMSSVRKKLEVEIAEADRALARSISELEAGLGRLAGYKVTIK